MKRPRARRLFRGVVAGGPGGDRAAKLTLYRGAHRRVVDEAGDFVSEHFEPTASLPSNIGDAMVVCGPLIEETVAAIVTEIDHDGGVWLRFPSAKLLPGTEYVQILPITTTAKVKRKARAA